MVLVNENEKTLLRKLLIPLTVWMAARVVVTNRHAPSEGVKVSSLMPFDRKGDGHVLSAKEIAALDRGEYVILKGRTRGRGTAVCDVASPPQAVWKTFTDFNKYPGKFPNCIYANVYDKKLMKNRVELHHAMGFGMKLRNFVEYSFSGRKLATTWTLDPSRKSDFVGVQGQFVVDPHPTKRNWSRVWYSTDVSLPQWLPSYIANQIPKQSGIKGLDFVKTQSEKFHLMNKGRSWTLSFPTLSSSSSSTKLL